MNPIRREVLNGLFVLVVASLMSAAFAAFQVSFDLQLWVLILVGVSVAVSGYVVFEIALRYMSSTAEREKEWLKRIGTPASFEWNLEGTASGADSIRDALKTIIPGSDYTVIYYFDAKQGGGVGLGKETLNSRNKTLSFILEQQKHGIIREYKRVISFDRDVLARNAELKSGILRVGEGPGTIDREMGNHCLAMMSIPGCSLFVAPAIVKASVILLGQNRIAMTVEGDHQDAGLSALGTLHFSDPPNSEIIERFRQIERATERRMVSVHKILFPEDEAPTARAGGQ